MHLLVYCRSHKHDDAAHNSMNFHLVKVASCLHKLELVERRGWLFIARRAPRTTCCIT